MWELFQQILKEKMTPNQFLILYGIKKSLSLPLPDNQSDVQQLKSLGFIEQDASLSIKANKVIARYENYFIKAKKRTSIQLMGKEFLKRINEYRDIFPARKLPSAKPARVNGKPLENSFRWFFETYDHTWPEIIKATRMYVNEFRDKDYQYMMTSQYFISKQDKHRVKHSTLADYCDLIKEGIDTEDKHFKEKVV